MREVVVKHVPIPTEPASAVLERRIAAYQRHKHVLFQNMNNSLIKQLLIAGGSRESLGDDYQAISEMIVDMSGSTPVSLMMAYQVAIAWLRARVIDHSLSNLLARQATQPMTREEIREGVNDHMKWTRTANMELRQSLRAMKKRQEEGVDTYPIIQYGP